MPLPFPITIPGLAGRRDEPHPAVGLLQDAASIQIAPASSEPSPHEDALERAIAGYTNSRQKAKAQEQLKSLKLRRESGMRAGELLQAPSEIRDILIGSPERHAEYRDAAPSITQHTIRRVRSIRNRFVFRAHPRRRCVELVQLAVCSRQHLGQ
jgi:hypothetical protein